LKAANKIDVHIKEVLVWEAIELSIYTDITDDL